MSIIYSKNGELKFVIVKKEKWGRNVWLYIMA